MHHGWHTGADADDDAALTKILADCSTVRHMYKRCVHPAAAELNLFFVTTRATRSAPPTPCSRATHSALPQTRHTASVHC